METRLLRVLCPLKTPAKGYEPSGLPLLWSFSRTAFQLPQLKPGRLEPECNQGVPPCKKKEGSQTVPVW